MCGATYCSRSSLWGHVNRHHRTSWREYEDKYGNVEKDISRLESFVCKICQASVKNERNVILRHVTRTHGITWKKYVENYVKNNNFLQQSDEVDQVINDETKEITMISLFKYFPEIGHQNFFVKCISIQSAYENGQVTDIYPIKV